MDFSTHRKQQSSEPILPMINVVFLLLVFFLLTAQIAPRAPFEVRPPATNIETGGQSAPVLFVSSTGDTFFQGQRGDAAFTAIAKGLGGGGLLTLRADASVEAAHVVRVMTKLRALGIETVQLVGQSE
jgi:biopolymer transport protein ExbD